MDRSKQQSGCAGSQRVIAIDKSQNRIQEKERRRKLDELLVDHEFVFLYMSFFLMLVELASSAFALYCAQSNSVSDYTKDAAAVAYYVLLALLTAALMVNSIVSTIHAKEERSRTLGYEKQRASVQMLQEIMTIASSVLWVLLSVSSIVMCLCECDWLCIPTLVVSVVAPLLGAASAFFRVYYVSVDHKIRTQLHSKDKDYDKSSEGKKAVTTRESLLYKIKTAVYVIVGLFELAHCGCHIYEAYLLMGNTHQIYSIQNTILLSIQVALATLLLVLETVQFCLDSTDVSPTDKDDTQGMSRSTLIERSQTSAAAEQLYSEFSNNMRSRSSQLANELKQQPGILHSAEAGLPHFSSSNAATMR